MLIRGSRRFIRRRLRKVGRRRGVKLRPRTRRAVAKIAKSVVNRTSEHKYFDTTGATTFSYSGTIIQLTTVPQGNTDITRSGDQLEILNLYVDFYVTPADSAVHLFQVLFFQWFPFNASDAPTVGEVLQTVANGTVAPISPLHHDLKRNFKLLYRLKGASYVTSGPSIVRKQIVLKPKYKKLSFVGGTTDAFGHIYVLFVGDGSVSMTYGIYSRLNFTDV